MEGGDGSLSDTRRILVIADDDIRRTRVSRYLRHEGAISAVTGDVAPTTYRGVALDLIVAIGTGDSADALAALSLARHAAPTVPLIVVAPAPTAALRARAFALGAADVVSWPVAAAEFVARVRAALQQY